MSTDKLLLWAYPKVDCRLAFVDSGAPGSWCAYNSLDEQDGHHACFLCRGWRSHIHRWTDHLDNLCWWPHDHGFGRKLDPIRSSRGNGPDHIDYGYLCPNNIVDHADNSPFASRYNGKRIDNSDLLEAIDHANHKLSEAFDLVNLVSSQITRTVPLDCHGSARPTHVTTHERLRMSLAIMTTPEGWIVQIKATPPSRCFPLFPHGLRNAAN